METELEQTEEGKKRANVARKGVDEYAQKQSGKDGKIMSWADMSEEPGKPEEGAVGQPTGEDEETESDPGTMKVADEEQDDLTISPEDEKESCPDNADFRAYCAKVLVRA